MQRTFFYIWRKIFCKNRVIVPKKMRKWNRGMNFLFCWSSIWSISAALRSIILNPAQIPVLCVTLVSLLLDSCMWTGDTVSPVQLSHWREKHLWRPFHPILKQLFKTEPLSIVLEGTGRSNLGCLPNLWTEKRKLNISQYLGTNCFCWLKNCLNFDTNT